MFFVITILQLLNWFFLVKKKKKEKKEKAHHLWSTMHQSDQGVASLIRVLPKAFYYLNTNLSCSLGLFTEMLLIVVCYNMTKLCSFLVIWEYFKKTRNAS